MTRSLRARIEREPELEGITHLYLGDILLRSEILAGKVTVAYLQEIADRINALIDARVTELLEANSREVERRRVAEKERDELCTLFDCLGAAAALTKAVDDFEQTRARIKEARESIRAGVRPLKGRFKL